MVPKAFRLKGAISLSLNMSFIPLKDKGFIWLKNGRVVNAVNQIMLLITFAKKIILKTK